MRNDVKKNCNDLEASEFMGLPKENLSFNPWPHSPHMKIVNLIEAGKVCLDVGCASGYIARELKRKKCRVYGVEIDPKLARKAQKYCVEVLNVDVEKGRLPFKPNQFDVIILSDILEHLVRPDLVLSRLRWYIKPGGYVIASIPNIARIEIRLNLLLGSLEYQKTGILSKSHLRFFTLKSAKKLFEIAGYQIERIDYTGLGSIIGVLPTLFAFQFIIVARPRSRRSPPTATMEVVRNSEVSIPDGSAKCMQRRAETVEDYLRFLNVAGWLMIQPKFVS